MKSSNKASERYTLAREIAEEGIILLKNRKGLLPLCGRTLAVFGRTQIDTIPCGTGSAFCRSEYCVNVLDGLDGEKIPYDKALAAYYRRFAEENPVERFGVWGSGSHLQEEPMLTDAIVSSARDRVDTALFVIGRTAGENDDASAVSGDYYLSSIEEEQLSLVCRYFSDVIVVINSGNMMDLSFAQTDRIGALLLLSLPGMEGGAALAAILSGRVSPSGRLCDTVARSYSAYPTSNTFGKRGGLIQKYTEDSFVGYRYFASFEEAQKDVLYPFGFGLSYTDFSIAVFAFATEGDRVTVTLTVKNTGSVRGRETVMLFGSAPRGRLPKPSYVLCAFAKTKELAPNEKEQLSLSFTRDALAFFDDGGVLGVRDSWVSEEGTYRVFFGTDVSALRLAGTYDEAKNRVFRTCERIPTMLEERLVGYRKAERIEHIIRDAKKGIPVPPEGRFEIEAKHFALTAENDRSTVRLLIGRYGVYRFFFDNCRVMIGDAPIASGEDVILAIGITELTVLGECGDICIEKADDTVTIGQGTSVIEGGHFTDIALFVISKPFTDDGICKHGRSLARMHTRGRYAVYSLHVEKAGIYDFALRYSNPHSDADLRNTFSFLVSNVGQDIDSVTLHHTTDTDAPRFQTSDAFSLALPAGSCQLKIVSVTKTPPEIAYFVVTPSDKRVQNTEKCGALPFAEDIAIEKPRVRRELPKEVGTADFRSVLSGSLSLDAFSATLSNEELSALTCGNGEGQIGYLPQRGIPEALWADGPVGLRLSENTTVYPASSMLASTWNTALAERFGDCIGEEAEAHGIDIWLAPGINIHRDPLCGRSFEYYSEDPFLTGKMASAVVRGVKRHRVLATVKHFAANSTEFQRMRSDSYVSARALREIYMKAFEIVIREANPPAIMTSYNYINNEKVPESALFCQQILREEFGFEGVLMTDWCNDSDHVRELAAGHDLKMSFGSPERVAAAIENGTLCKEAVMESVHRILTMLQTQFEKRI